MKVLREAEKEEVQEKEDGEALSKGTLREFQKDQGVQEVKKTPGLGVVTLWGRGGGNAGGSRVQSDRGQRQEAVLLGCGSAFTALLTDHGRVYT
jgi:hypothetical protein